MADCALEDRGRQETGERGVEQRQEVRDLQRKNGAQGDVIIGDDDLSTQHLSFGQHLRTECIASSDVTSAASASVSVFPALPLHGISASSSVASVLVDFRSVASGRRSADDVIDFRFVAAAEAAAYDSAVALWTIEVSL